MRCQLSITVLTPFTLALILLALGLGIANAWFWSRDELREEAQLGQPVELTLEGTGANGEIRNHQQIYKSTTRAYPGDKILDTITIKMGENTMESALRV